MAGALGITISSPANYSSVTIPVQLQIIANAYAGAGASVAKVEFFQGAALLATATTLPYSFTWSVLTPGAYSVWAKVTDSNGATAQTPVTTVSAITNAQLALTLAPGLNNSTMAADVVQIQGTVQAPPNSSIILGSASSTIPSMAGVIEDNGQFFFNNVKLQPGINSLTITVTDMDGNQASVPLTITSTAPAPFVFAASIQDGIAPAAVSLDLIDFGVTPYALVEVSCQGNGSVDATIPPQGSGILADCTYPGPGTYTPTVTILNRLPDGTMQVVYTGQVMIYIYSTARIDGLLQGILAQALSRLNQGNISGAVNAFSQEASDTYLQAFTGLGAGLSPFVSSLSAPENGSISEDIGKYVLERTTSQGTFGATAVLIRGTDGVWHITSM